LERLHARAVADPDIRVIDNPVNLGLGGSYKRGAKAVSATSIMMRASI
jgi:GT2 family glycosyltransferase